MTEETVNVAEAKKKFSELLGQVAFGKKHILITKRGKPMARLVPADEINLHLCNAKGWLEDDDPFFADIDRIIQDRSQHVPRIIKRPPAKNVPG
jgi:prevent-host-death family protein